MNDLREHLYLLVLLSPCILFHMFTLLCLNHLAFTHFHRVHFNQMINAVVFLLGLVTRRLLKNKLRLLEFLSFLLHQFFVLLGKLVGYDAFSPGEMHLVVGAAITFVCKFY